MDKFSPLNHAEITAFLINFKWLSAFATIGFSLCVTLVVMPKIIAISKKKNLTASTNERTSHKGIVPTLGGIGVFTGLMLTVNIAAVLFATYNQLVDLLIFNILILMLLLVGVLDDIMTILPRKKFIYQLIIALASVLGTNIYINSFTGLFGIHHIPFVLAICFSALVIVIIINAYNLIDGIDGLAGVLGVIVSAFMALVFSSNNYFFYSLICLSLLGALVGFLVYNFSHRRKIFLGDTGSMVVGFVLAFQVLLYLNVGANKPGLIGFKNAPIFVLALLSYPLFDTLRVFFIRIKNKRSPFSADRNHIHHRLLDLGLPHKQATIIIACYTFFITGLAYVLNNLHINIAFVIVLIVAVAIMVIPFLIHRKTNKYKVVFPEKKS